MKTDLEKVIQGLESCASWVPECAEGDSSCPYKAECYSEDNGDMVPVMKDALEILRGLRARMLTLDEAKRSGKPVYLQEKWTDGTISGEWLAPFADEDKYGYVRFGARFLYKPEKGIKWQIWSGEPTEETSWKNEGEDKE